MTELLLPSAEDVRQYARGALKAADIGDVLPIPLDDITTAVGLHKQALFDLGDPSMPAEMLRIAKRLTGKLAGAFARREKTVYVDLSLSAPRSRFTHGHELGHNALPWHAEFYHVDDRNTLDPSTTALLEREANFFAADLIFGIERFNDQADNYTPALGAALQLADTFGASKHAALRRYASGSHRPLALVALGQHIDHRPFVSLPVWANQCESSASFNEKFGHVSTLVGARLSLANHASVHELAGMTRALHDDTMTLRLDTRRGMVNFKAHLFFNGYMRFLLIHEDRRFLARNIRVVEI